MPKKRDPKASVLAYFAVVGIEEAKETLALAREVLRQRQPRAPKRQARPTHRPEGPKALAEA